MFSNTNILHPDTWEMIAHALILWTFAYVFVLFRQIRRVYTPEGDTRCTACSYSLRGLADDAPCPECGSTERRGSVRRWVGPARVFYTFPVLAFLLGMLLSMVLDNVAAAVGAWRIISEGFNPRSAWIVAKRAADWSRHDMPIALYPLLLSVFSPFLSEIPTRRGRWGAMVLLLLVGFIGGVARLGSL